MLLRIVEKENGEILVLYNDGRYGKASISTLREIFEGIETVEDMVGETDGWELDYTEMEDYPGKTRAYIDDGLVLHIYTPNVFAPVVEKVSSAKKAKAQSSEAKYLTISEYAEVVRRVLPVSEFYALRVGSPEPFAKERCGLFQREPHSQMISGLLNIQSVQESRKVKGAKTENESSLK